MPNVNTSHGLVTTGEVIRVTAKTNPAKRGEVTTRRRGGLMFDDMQAHAVQVLDETDEELAARVAAGQYAVNLAGVTAIDGDGALQWWTPAEHTAAGTKVYSHADGAASTRAERDRLVHGK